MSEAASLRLFGTATDSIVDGVGLRYAVFVQGCTHRCPGCHNPESQPSEGGYIASIDELVREIEGNKLIGGATLSGGEPFEQCDACVALARKLKGHGLNLWVYSGYLYEDLIAGKPDAHAPDLLALCDVLVDGPFVEALHSYDLKWRGSSNQRVIDLNATRERGVVVLWREQDDFPEIPSSW